MSSDPRDQLVGKYERSGWPAEQRPDFGPAPGWSIPMVVSLNMPRSHAPSPDGERIAFLWDQADLSGLYVLPAAGGWPLRLTFDRDPAPYWFDDPPQWSSDGQWLAYTDKGHVWVVAASGGVPRMISDFTDGAGAPRWMPKSHNLLITTSRAGQTHILMTDREGAWPRPVSSAPGRAGPGGHAYSPHVAPDGRNVVYVHQALDDLNRTDLMISNLETGEVTPLTSTPNRHDITPRWSPDGRRIAFLSDRPGFYELFVLDFETRQERQVTHAGHDLGGIDWSPDGTRIVCTVNRAGALDLAIVDVETGELRDLRTAFGVHSRPHWLPDGRSIVFEYEDPQTPHDIYRIDIETRQMRQLTFSKLPALEALDLVAPERVSYFSFDDLEIPAFLYRPKNPNGAAIVYPHGGPTAQYCAEFDIEAQYFVAKGYTYLAPNFRGSTGYGIEFTRANFGVWGIDDMQDCLAAADYLDSLPGIDRKRIGISGASYGSYLAVCALARDPLFHFACGVAKFGDCNILTSWAQASQGAREDLERMMGHPSRARSAYRAGSPVWDVANIRRPLLIVHGLLDPIVSPLQSEELVEALRREGKPFEYKTYPDEGHGLLLRKNRIDFHQRLERFLDWYLL
jgi:dipeptidyl aminopeptidase/acylaminoacyl peptidase